MDPGEEPASADREQCYRWLVESALDIMAIIRPDGTIVYVNPAVREVGGYDPNELIGRNYLELVHPGDVARARANLAAIVKEPGRTFRMATRFRHKDGTTRQMESVTRNLVGTPGADGIVVTTRDITGRSEALETSARSERQYRTLFESSRDALLLISPPDWRYTNGNGAALRMFGIRDLAAIRTLGPADLSPEFQPDGAASAEKARQTIERTLAQGSNYFEWTHRRMTGEVFPATVLLTRVEVDGVAAVQVTVRDITERKAGEQALARVTRALRTLSAGNRAVIHAQSPQELYLGMCQAAVDGGRYRMAWVGAVVDDEARSVKPVAWAGNVGTYLDSISVSWGDNERGQGPTGRCIRRGEPQVSQNIATDPRMARWRNAALSIGFASSVALPVRDGAAVVGAMMIYAAEPQAFDEDEMALLRNLADELSYGIASLRAGQAQEASAQELQRAMEATVHAVAATVEMRDPYTAGHQMRVANLCSAIARRMGLSDDRVHALELAASIHDLGKIAIPSEILAKPGTLTAVERNLVQTHAQIGYEIIKDVRFPWPIADMIWQHHERLNGNGYPRGLKDDQVMIEARILSVADMVEAMSSHRPYRPGLGLDAALAQVVSERGSTLDADAVDACVAVFREEGFKFTSHW